MTIPTASHRRFFFVSHPIIFMGLFSIKLEYTVTNMLKTDFVNEDTESSRFDKNLHLYKQDFEGSLENYIYIVIIKEEFTHEV